MNGNVKERKNEREKKKDRENANAKERGIVIGKEIVIEIEMIRIRIESSNREVEAETGIIELEDLPPLLRRETRDVKMGTRRIINMTETILSLIRIATIDMAKQMIIRIAKTKMMTQ